MSDASARMSRSSSSVDVGNHARHSLAFVTRQRPERFFAPLMNWFNDSSIQFVCSLNDLDIMMGGVRHCAEG